MASITSLSADDVQRLFSQDAVFYVEDPVVGERVVEMQKKGFPIESADGLDFCKQNVLDDTVCKKHTMTGLSNLLSACPARFRCPITMVRPWNLRSIPNRSKEHLRIHDWTEP